ncbi:hypothetical protein JCM8547_000953 [Rhodosporidiobolus lusitaniae]
MAAFTLGNNQHRRRVSLPSTPPETPLDGYFGPDSRKTTATHGRGSSIFPATPPQTPTRVLSEKDQVLPPPSGHRSRPSYAYPKHHRRTSTQTLLRLAAAKQNLQLTPLKGVILFLIVFSATYLASFLPSPLSFILPHHRRASPPGVYTYHPSGVVPPSQPSSIDQEMAERKAWAESFPNRIPPHQHVVEVDEALATAAAISSNPQADEPLAGKEAPASAIRPGGRRRPHRLAKELPVSNPFEGEDAARPLSADSDYFDHASRSPRQRPHEAPARQAQLNRMKKVALAKGRDARIGKTAASGSAAAAREEQDRVIVDAGPTGRRKLRNPKGAMAVDAAAAEYEAVRKTPGKGTKHEPAVVSEEEKAAREAAAARVEARSAALTEELLQDEDPNKDE